MAEMVRPTDVLAVHDHPLLRDGLNAMLANEHDMRVVGEAEDGERPWPASPACARKWC